MARRLPIAATREPNTMITTSLKCVGRLFLLCATHVGYAQYQTITQTSTAVTTVSSKHQGRLLWPRLDSSTVRPVQHKNPNSKPSYTNEVKPSNLTILALRGTHVRYAVVHTKMGTSKHGFDEAKYQSRVFSLRETGPSRTIPRMREFW